MDDFLKILSKWSIKKIVITCICLIVVLCVYNIDYIYNFYLLFTGNTADTTYNSHIVPENEKGVSKNNIKIIHDYVVNYGKISDPHILFMGVYKFLPGSKVYMYQGRALIAYFSRMDDGDKFVHEANISWMSLINTKEAMEYVLRGKPVILNLYAKSATIEGDKNAVVISRQEQLVYLYNMGIRRLQYIPILSSDQTIGYIILYSTSPDDNFLQLGYNLAPRLSVYLE